MVFSFWPHLGQNNNLFKIYKILLLLDFLPQNQKLAHYVLLRGAETQTEEFGGKTETPTTLTAETPDPGRASSQLRAYS